MGEPVQAIVAVIVGIVIAAILIVIFTLIFRWLWNSTMPEVFGLKTVTFWQALKILILAGILFGSQRVVERQVEVENQYRQMPGRR